ncbi:MAG: winged helix-turn-helix domain-containing protein, partial [Lysobacteraceae bacterium]
MSVSLTDRFHLGEWQVHASENCIVRADERVQLEPRVMDLLVFLCRHPDETLGRDEILQSVWGSIHHSDSVIARAISLLRQHLNDDARNPAYIRTIPSRGYRLIAKVQASAEEPPAPPAQASATTTGENRPERTTDDGDAGDAGDAVATPARWLAWAPVVLVALILLSVAGVWWHQRSLDEHAEASTTSALTQL